MVTMDGKMTWTSFITTAIQTKQQAAIHTALFWLFNSEGNNSHDPTTSLNYVFN